MRGQAAVQAVYNPDRLTTPLLKEKGKWRPISFEKALAQLKSKTHDASQKGPERIRMLTETVGQSLLALFADALNGWKAQGPLVFEPFAYESLKSANEKVFPVLET